MTASVGGVVVVVVVRLRLPVLGGLADILSLFCWSCERGDRLFAVC